MEVCKWKSEWHTLPGQPKQWPTQAALFARFPRPSWTCSTRYMRRWHLRVVVREEAIFAIMGKTIDFPLVFPGLSSRNV